MRNGSVHTVVVRRIDLSLFHFSEEIIYAIIKRPLVAIRGTWIGFATVPGRYLILEKELVRRMRHMTRMRLKLRRGSGQGAVVAT
jgi:hypothetical protein